MTTQFIDHMKFILGMCEEPGCNRVGTPCHLPRYNDPETDEWIDEIDYHYCVSHAHENGFCWCCGEFWGGIESFEFMNKLGLCDNCEIEVEDYDDYETDYSDLEDYYPYP